MSLVGNLEDLSLGDILQIISLSQKSGVLALSSELGTGRIVFRQGLVEAACVKGAPNNLRDLLVAQGEIDPAGYDASVSRAQDLGQPIEAVLESDAGLASERIGELIHAAVESAILEMFTWPSGDFSFDVRTELDSDDPVLTLQQGMNAQYLAMEGLRLRDERERDGELGGASIDPNAETDPNIGADQNASSASAATPPRVSRPSAARPASLRAPSTGTSRTRRASWEPCSSAASRASSRSSRRRSVRGATSAPRSSTSSG